MTRTETLALQRRLNEIGLSYQILGENLEDDGIYGKRTREVHRAWLDQDAEVPTITPEEMGWLVDDEQITQILLVVMEAVGLIVAAIGTVKRKGAIDPTLVMRLPGRDIRLPVRTQRQTPRGPGRSDPRGHFSTD